LDLARGARAAPVVVVVVVVTVVGGGVAAAAEDRVRWPWGEMGCESTELLDIRDLRRRWMA